MCILHYTLTPAPRNQPAAGLRLSQERAGSCMVESCLNLETMAKEGFGTGRPVPYRRSLLAAPRLLCPYRPASICRARLEVPVTSIDKSVPRLQSADVRVIIDFGGLRRDNLTSIPTLQPPQSRPTVPASGFEKRTGGSQSQTHHRHTISQTRPYQSAETLGINYIGELRIFKMTEKLPS